MLYARLAVVVCIEFPIGASTRFLAISVACIRIRIDEFIAYVFVFFAFATSDFIKCIKMLWLTSLELWFLDVLNVCRSSDEKIETRSSSATKFIRCNKNRSKHFRCCRRLSLLCRSTTLFFFVFNKNAFAHSVWWHFSPWAKVTRTMANWQRAIAIENINHWPFDDRIRREKVKLNRKEKQKRNKKET